MKKLKGFSLKTRLVHMILFESVGLVLFTLTASLILKLSLIHLGVLGVICSLIAMLWNFIYNYIFDYFEYQLGRSRFKRGIYWRLIHILMFEFGLMLVTLPIIAYWLNMGILSAFFMDLGVIVFFLGYAMLFNWVFDWVYIRLILSSESR